MFEKRIGQKPQKSASSVLVRHRNWSGVVELVGREPLMFAKVENGVTKLCQIFRQKNRKNAISGHAKWGVFVTKKRPKYVKVYYLDDSVYEILHS